MGLTYGIDVHGTLAARQLDGTQGPSTLHPLLVPLMKALRERGERVFIVSGPPVEVIAQEVKALGLKAGIHYDALISVVDHLRDRDVDMTENPPGSNHWWCNDGMWNGAKGWICREYGIDILIDDQLEYADSCPDTTSFVHVSADVLHPDEDQMKMAAAKMIGGE
jgi:hypothetical protein